VQRIIAVSLLPRSQLFALLASPLSTKECPMSLRLGRLLAIDAAIRDVSGFAQLTIFET
jgi:hypothetical protein